jgi:hypothetical protein
VTIYPISILSHPISILSSPISTLSSCGQLPYINTVSFHVDTVILM